MKGIYICMLMALGLCAVGCNKETADTKRITLTFVETMTSPERTQVLQSMIAQYEELNPSVHIELISPPYEQADNKLTLLLNSNQVLDIIETRDYTVKQFVNNKKLRDLSPYFDAWDEKDGFLDLALAASRTVNDTPYLIPQFLYVKALFVRTDVLARYGIPLPATMDELYDACIALTGRGPGQFGFSFRGKANAFKISDIMLAADTGNINPDNIYEGSGGGFFLDTDSGRESLSKYIDLFKKASPPDSINWGFNEQINGFVSGTTPFLIQDPDVVSSLKGVLNPEQYTVIPIPPGSMGRRYLDYGFNGLSIPASSRHPDEAWNFISWMISGENNAAFCKAYGPLPVHKFAFESDPWFSSGVYRAWADELNDEKTIFVKYPLDAPQFPAWSQIQEQSMQALLLGNASIDESIRLWAEYWGF